uniref:N-acetyltransferase domain-containing protein n=1 Tax=Chrysotila carterae TaxID=13221 RepID=A0A7S4C1W0_CHRCT|mmetsp:Transcript_53648/g.116972  ORF Transcript_53648/g.116972 Transcript_53648/m.116972 type:complete len:213 (-) Transcript_53648:127-765(-)
MRLNEDTILQTSSFRLVPYRPEHVLKYNEWMQDETLLYLTCSDQLTLEEEYKNQEEWRLDPSKLTFIICDGREGGLLDGMCGDVNAFLKQIDPDEAEDYRVSAAPLENPLYAELEVMIALPSARRRGLAGRCLLIFMHYMLQHLPKIVVFGAKITNDNEASMKLFYKLGFKLYKDMPVFEQVELRASASELRGTLRQLWFDLEASEVVAPRL